MQLTIKQAADLLLFASLISSGLMAGLFFGWAVSVIPGTLRISDRAYISTMQSINAAIVNPLFVITFIGTALALAGAAILHFRSGDTRRAWWLAAATVTYTIGLLGVTVGGNIPLNNALDRFDLDAATTESIAKQRSDYEGPWNRWHNVRTVAAVAALAMTSAAALAATEGE